MTDFDTILKEWADAVSHPSQLTPKPVSLHDMITSELLDEFCFFCAERAEAMGRNSAFNEGHLLALFAELKRRNLFPE